MHHHVRRIAVRAAQHQAALDHRQADIGHAGLDVGPSPVGQHPGVVVGVMRREAANKVQPLEVVVDTAAESDQPEGAERSGHHQRIARPVGGVGRHGMHRCCRPACEQIGNHRDVRVLAIAQRAAQCLRHRHRLTRLRTTPLRLKHERARSVGYRKTRVDQQRLVQRFQATRPGVQLMIDGAVIGFNRCRRCARNRLSKRIVHSAS